MSMHRTWIELHKDYPHEDWCLLWPFSRDPNVGRGSFSAVNGESPWAHRVMCEVVHGPAPADKPQAAHSCGNGHLGCVNPRHLSWANNSDNQHQRYAHGRGNPNANGNRSRYTPEQAAEMRSLYVNGSMTQLQIAERFGCSLGLVQYFIKYRVSRGHTGKIMHWSPEEDKKLADLLAIGLKHEEIAEQINRPHQAVSARASRLKLKSRRGSFGKILPIAS